MIPAVPPPLPLKALITGSDIQSLASSDGQTSTAVISSEFSDLENNKHLDVIRKACLLCQRKFANLTQLQKHEAGSALHKKNLEVRIESICLHIYTLFPFLFFFVLFLVVVCLCVRLLVAVNSRGCFSSIHG